MKKKTFKVLLYVRAASECSIQNAKNCTQYTKTSTQYAVFLLLVYMKSAAFASPVTREIENPHS